MALSMVALVHDLGRPARFVNMIRVPKVTSPMSVGSWLLTGYVPLAGAAAASALSVLGAAGALLGTRGRAVSAVAAPLCSPPRRRRGSACSMRG